MSKIDSIKVFATQTEAEANKPTDAGKKKLYGVVKPDGTTRWLWSDGYAQAIYQVLTKLDGWKVTASSEKAVPAAMKAENDSLKAEIAALQARLAATQSVTANPALTVQPPADQPNANRGRRNTTSTQPVA